MNLLLQFLSPKALAFVQSSLGSTYSESLGPAAPVSRRMTTLLLVVLFDAYVLSVGRYCQV